MSGTAGLGSSGGGDASILEMIVTELKKWLVSKEEVKIGSRRFTNRPAIVAITGTLLIVAMTGAMFSYQAASIKVGEPEGGGGGTTQSGEVINVTLPDKTGTSTQQSEVTENVDIPDKNLKSVTFTLKWKDEADIKYIVRSYTNAPDQFQLKVSGPGNISAESAMIANKYDPAGGEGKITLTIDIEQNKKGDNGTGAWKVTIVCGDCGDQNGVVIAYVDDANGWTLTPSYEYYKK